MIGQSHEKRIEVISRRESPSNNPVMLRYPTDINCEYLLDQSKHNRNHLSRGGRAMLQVASILKNNHDYSNVRLNFSASKPKSFCSQETVTNSSPVQQKCPKFDFEHNAGVSQAQNVAKHLKPVMQFLIQALEKDCKSGLLGSLPRQLERQAKISSKKAPVNYPQLNRELSGISLDEFKLRFGTSAIGSSTIQAYLDQCPKDEALAIGELFLNDYETLIRHQYMHSILRGVIGTHDELTHRVDKFCRRRFNSLATDEYASRILQRLVEHSPSFRKFSLKRLRNNSSLWLRSIAGMFVLSTCMKFSDPEEYSFVTNLLFSDTNQLINSKMMKRAVVSLIEAAPPHHLDLIFDLLDVRSNFFNYLSDKYMTYILIALLRRDYQPAIDMLVNSISSHYNVLITKCYFKLLANKLISVGSTHVLDAINNSLRALTYKDVCYREYKLDNIYYYMFMTLSTFTIEYNIDINNNNSKLYQYIYQLYTSQVMHHVDTYLKSCVYRCIECINSI